ncbi:MAG TPA: bifunctional oligoribonuclease/PAP phosphatase NrnA [Chitinispirillaceae bacterium]|nr:bifunctional oligoribonuclease/PAP phosphatase NrnA [Chitinispirillaceae bacterium]
MIWNEIDNVIKNNQSFIISSHMSLDGDSIGSQLSFYWFLKSLGKDVVIFDKDALPSKFHFLQNAAQFTNVRPDRHFDTLVVLDCSNPERMGWDNPFDVAATIINIDHHRDNSHFGNHNVVQTSAAATGEIIYQFFTESDITFPSFVAEALYTAIISDTGGFRFSNTNSRILRVCADLADKGADCSKIYERVYSTHPRRALVLQSRIWASLKFFNDGKVCIMEMPLKILDEIGAVYSDSEGMADHTITAEGVEVGMMLKYSESETHFSLRSKGKIDVGKIAQKVPGGGGHYSAAGCTIKEPRDQALALMLSIIAQELE